MTTFSRTDTSVMGRWWWTVDRWSLAAVVALMAFGTMLALASSPAVAERLGIDSLYFVKRHLVFLPVAAAVIVATSLMTPLQIRRLALVAFAGCLVGLGATLWFGVEINGARRWLSLAGLSIQVTEFAKPTFAVVTAWLFAEKLRDAKFPGYSLAVISFALLVGLTISQPDMGQTAVIGAVWMTQFFLAGLPMWLVVGLIVLGLAGLAGSYMTMSHVASRIDRFIDPATGDTYQIERSIEAFSNGGLFGQGPGEGTVKNVLPDAHADFVFAVAGEELGLILTLVIVILFAFIVLRGLVRTMGENNLFVLLAVSGLLVQFGLQTLINMASSLQLIPTKGMTLPFISYGGSSLLAIALGIGMVLALTRRRSGQAEGS
ncbi:MAG: putative peptidoglycan glycosyltransferase FtsW [Alphaproteobacteria bacterium]|nr:putative peptidoglycan glycosyltransferase FtsW [Alphaproteobacteria bacterium]MCZ6509539.1 putative peptidoglycan glycosyltransferase FtsW [Alphaproteobacteria bacterium]MCZ6587943.1 putative peptidoglycan glycosyltransferase FtsW [Alphaproteobacteria bacterium]MCZ6593000.1 putative peptidoglycan glycosyltransferase FtsW [Alphaproteobacteria bacterium]MCZ6840193.1 putative peptidoglycan glycosyltransferase FtsW [Alphaproteobacteria bacterium]